MAKRRTNVELDTQLVDDALRATGTTLRATVEEGLRLVIARTAEQSARDCDVLRQHLAEAAKAIDTEVLMSGDAWR